jgi:hypothetical protein
VFCKNGSVILNKVTSLLRPDSLQDESLEFDQSGTVTQKDGKSSYELFNIQSSGSSNEIKLEKVIFLKQF